VLPYPAPTKSAFATLSKMQIIVCKRVAKFPRDHDNYYMLSGYLKAFEAFVDKYKLDQTKISTAELIECVSLFDAEYLLSLPFYVACVQPGDTFYRIMVIKRYYTERVEE
jgi:hypothetical protein